MNAPDLLPADTAPSGLASPYLADTHEVANIGHELADYDMYRQDAALLEALAAVMKPGESPAFGTSWI